MILTVTLRDMRRLEKLTYLVTSMAGNIQGWAVKQLEQLPENDIKDICFDLSDELDGEKWVQIDTILAGKKFKSLQRVSIWPETNIQHFPKLGEKRIAQVLRRHTYK